MAAPRQSAFMPTIKCSQCGNEVEISMMGDHVCGGPPAVEAPPPAAPDVLGGAFASVKGVFGFGYGSKAAAPPTVDTKSANQAYKPDQLTPISVSTGSRGTISPKTPTGRTNSTGGDDYFPAIAGANSPSQNTRPGGYGGFGDENEQTYGGGYGTSPQKPATLLQRKIEGLAAPPPLERSNTSASYGSNKPRVPRKNGYGGFGPLNRNKDREMTNEDQFNDWDAPTRAPSAPGSRPELARAPTAPAADYSERPATRDRQNRPSYGSREPPQQSSLRGSYGRSQETRRHPSSSLSPSDGYGPGNPYHSPSVSQSSSNSGYSHNSRQPSMASSNTSPARSSAGSRRHNSGTQDLDDLMKDLESSMDSLNPRDMRVPPSRSDSQSDMRNPAPAIRPRIDSLRSSSSTSASNQRPRSPYSPPSSRREPSYSQPQQPYAQPEASYSQPDELFSRPQAPFAQPKPQRSYSQPQAPFPEDRSRSPGPTAKPLHNRAQSQGRSRGNCKACRLPITGKSVSSADGRLTGKYHKACFVCTTCMEPFTSAEFYVLDDQPYCERHYHKLNGSLCGTCSVGIEGQYLEDESTTQKYHPKCFRCGDCGQVLRDGYFEVDGKAYCERDAYRRVQPKPQVAPPRPPRGPGMMGPPPSRGGPRPPPMGMGMGMGMGGRPGYGPPGGNRLGPPPTGGMPGMPRMNKRMTRLGMF
ncbi:lim domain-containing protein [Apiospora rasikravindrae]|uniref:Lim domain-containing protein n=1 Tax=Apiospora rasikravindrae TaxID=990691 RepID=A0ABR1TDP6_9PEZI